MATPEQPQPAAEPSFPAMVIATFFTPPVMGDSVARRGADWRAWLGKVALDAA